MSSNITITRRCEFCAKEFAARTTVTRFCSIGCIKKSYKAKIRQANIQKSNIETIERKVSAKSTLLEKEVLTIRNVAEILEFSLNAVYDLVNSGKLKATRISVRKTRILRYNLTEFMQSPEMSLTPIQVRRTSTVEAEGGETPLSKDNCLGIKDLIQLFGKSRDDLYTFLKRNNIPKVKIGKEVYFSKIAIDKLHRKFTGAKVVGHDKDREANVRLAKKGIKVSDCYSMPQCESMLERNRTNLYNMFSRRKVPKIKVGKEVYYAKKAVDRISKLLKEGGDL